MYLIFTLPLRKSAVVDRVNMDWYSYSFHFSSESSPHIFGGTHFLNPNPYSYFVAKLATKIFAKLVRLRVRNSEEISLLEGKNFRKIPPETPNKHDTPRLHKLQKRYWIQFLNLITNMNSFSNMLKAKKSD